MTTLRTKPALGAYLARPEIQRRRARWAWLAEMSLNEHLARARAAIRIIDAANDLRLFTRPTAVVARNLRQVADDLDALPSHLAATEGRAA